MCTMKIIHPLFDNVLLLRCSFSRGKLGCTVLAGDMDQENSLTPADPLCNVVEHRLKEALEYYASPSTPHTLSPQNSREQK